MLDYAQAKIIVLGAGFKLMTTEPGFVFFAKEDDRGKAHSIPLHTDDEIDEEFLQYIIETPNYKRDRKRVLDYYIKFTSDSK